MLKIKLMLSEKNFETVAKELTESGHQIDENADLLLTERKTYPALSAKFILTLTDGAQVDVTRSYYYIFKDFFEI